MKLSILVATSIVAAMLCCPGTCSAVARADDAAKGRVTVS